MSKELEKEETEDITSEIEVATTTTTEEPKEETTVEEVEEAPEETTEEVDTTNVEPDEKPFSLDDFNKERKILTGAEKPVEKTEVKPTDNKPKERDYSFVTDPKAIPHLKKMGNEAYNIVKNVFAKNKELEQLNAQLKTAKKSDLPDNYFSNPNAYVLAPEYQSLSTKVQLAEKVRTHWVAQEIQIRKTGKYVPLLGIDKDGNLQVGEAKEATDDDELLVKQNIEFGRDQALTVKQQLNNFVSGFQSRYNEDVAKVKEAEEQLYKDFDKPEHPTRKVQDAIMAQLPPSFKESVPSTLFIKGMAKAVLDVSTRDVKIKELEKEIAKLKGIRQDTQQAPPTKNRFSAPTGPKKGFSIEDFQRERQRA